MFLNPESSNSVMQVCETRTVFSRHIFLWALKSSSSYKCCMLRWFMVYICSYCTLNKMICSVKLNMHNGVKICMLFYTLLIGASNQQHKKNNQFILHVCFSWQLNKDLNRTTHDPFNLLRVALVNKSKPSLHLALMKQLILDLQRLATGNLSCFYAELSFAKYKE